MKLNMSYKARGPMNWLKSIYLVAILLIGASHVSAQETLPPDGEIEDAQVIIEKDRKIVLPFAQRYYDKISDQYKPSAGEKPVFSFADWFYAPPSVRLRYTASEYSSNDNNPSTQNEIRLGFGNYISPLVKITLATPQSKDYYLGVDFDHLSFMEGPVDGKNSGAGTSGLVVKGKYLTETATLSGRVGYNSTFGHFYGYDQALEVDRDTIRQTFNEFNVGVGLDGKPSDNASYNVKAGFNLIKDNFEASESKIELGAKMQFETESNIRAGLALEGTFSKYENNTFTANRNVYRAMPRVSFTANQLTVGVGARVLMVNDSTYLGKEFNVYPDISLDYTFSDQFKVFAGVKGDVRELYYDQVTRDNFFVGNNLQLRHGNQKLDVKAGIAGGSDKLGAELSVGYEQVDYLSFFVNGLSDTTRFDLIYDNGTTSILKTSLKVQYSSGTRYQGSISATYFNYSTSTVEFAWHRPTVEATVRQNFSLNDKLTLKANVIMLGGIKVVENYSSIDSYIVAEEQWSNIVASTLPMIIDISVESVYAINKNWGAFLSGENLLSSNYQRFYNYLNRGIMAKIGLKYSF